MASIKPKLHFVATAPDETPSVWTPRLQPTIGATMTAMRAAATRTENCRYCGAAFVTTHDGDAFCSGAHRKMWPYLHI